MPKVGETGSVDGHKFTWKKNANTNALTRDFTNKKPKAAVTAKPKPKVKAKVTPKKKAAGSSSQRPRAADLRDDAKARRTAAAAKPKRPPKNGAARKDVKKTETNRPRPEGGKGRDAVKSLLSTLKAATQWGPKYDKRDEIVSGVKSLLNTLPSGQSASGSTGGPFATSTKGGVKKVYSKANYPPIENADNLGTNLRRNAAAADREARKQRTKQNRTRTAKKIQARKQDR